MQVVILCGGIGTRLKEETEFRPKPMVKVGDKPILWHIMKHYAYYGYTDFVLALGYRGEMIKEYFFNFELLNCDFTVRFGDAKRFEVHDKVQENWTVTLVDTGENTLKGGRIKRIEQYVTSDRFMMTYGDGVSNVNLDQLLKFHESHGSAYTVTGVVPSMRFGELYQRDDGSVDFQEKRYKKPALVNGGYYVMDRSIFNWLEAREDCDFEIGPLEEISRRGELMMYRHEGFWHCMDHIRDMDALNRMWLEGNAPWKIWP
jgi:glucose-1-phosphate cytidylyltransferase